MTDPDDSFLDRRRAELIAGESAVPLEYEALRAAAREALDREPFDYAAGGAGSEDTILENRRAFQRRRIVPRVLRDVSRRDLGVERFGRALPAPLMLAPIGGQCAYHETGERATARAAGELGLPMALSTAASTSLEAVAEANGAGPRYFQLYWPNAWDVAASLVERAEAAGYDAIVLTVDSQLPTWRRRNLRNGYELGDTQPKANFESDPVVQERAEAAGTPVETYVTESPELRWDPSIDWTDLDELRGWTDLPIVLKGILSADDARRAAEWGADGVVVSNHGGRQIDGAVAPLDQLPAVVEAVDDDTVVVLDSGVRGGADAFKALALGADMVQIGRPYLFGLVLAGAAGVRDVVINLLAELESVMGLSGYSSVDEVDTDVLVQRPTSDEEGERSSR